MTNIEQRLQRLKPVTETVLGEPLLLTEQHIQNVRAFMYKSELKQSILALLAQPKSSSDVTQLLHTKNETLIRQNEGIIINLLHELELAGFVQSNWQDEEQKKYTVTKKGLQQLVGEQQREPLFQLRSLWQEVRSQ